MARVEMERGRRRGGGSSSVGVAGRGVEGGAVRSQQSRRSKTKTRTAAGSDLMRSEFDHEEGGGRW